LVRQILAFSRQADEEKRPINVTPIVKETLNLLRASIPMNVDINSTISTEDCVVNGAPGPIHQIVLNLSTNACHAMLERGGSLDVQLKVEAVEELREWDDGRTLAPGKYVCLTIADTGEGIPAEVVERIFEPYFTTKKEGEGTGLGLAMVHGIIQDMDGVILLKTERNQGSRFDVFLPLVEDVRLRSETENEIAPRGSGRIVVVDDEAAISGMIGSMLNAQGYRCSVFTNPLEALACVEASTGDPVELIISDVAMPQMTGVEFARAVAAKGWSIPTILCSGYTGGINWRTAGEVGIKAIIGKPVTRRKLAQTVREVLDGKCIEKAEIESCV
jgi:CheY-like chemotaxis protein